MLLFYYFPLVFMLSSCWVASRCHQWKNVKLSPVSLIILCTFISNELLNHGMATMRKTFQMSLVIIPEFLLLWGTKQLLTPLWIGVDFLSNGQSGDNAASVTIPHTANQVPFSVPTESLKHIPTKKIKIWLRVLLTNVTVLPTHQWLCDSQLIARLLFVPDNIYS